MALEPSCSEGNDEKEEQIIPTASAQHYFDSFKGGGALKKRKLNECGCHWEEDRVTWVTAQQNLFERKVWYFSSSTPPCVLEVTLYWTNVLCQVQKKEKEQSLGCWFHPVQQKTNFLFAQRSSKGSYNERLRALMEGCGEQTINHHH